MVGDDFVARSSDAGHTWSPLSSQNAVFDDVRVDRTVKPPRSVPAARSPTSQRRPRAMQHVGAANLHTLHIAESDEGEPSGSPARRRSGLDDQRRWLDLGGRPTVANTVRGFDQIGDGHR